MALEKGDQYGIPFPNAAATLVGHKREMGGL